MSLRFVDWSRLVPSKHSSRLSVKGYPSLSSFLPRQSLPRCISRPSAAFFLNSSSFTRRSPPLPLLPSSPRCNLPWTHLSPAAVFFLNLSFPHRYSPRPLYSLFLTHNNVANLSVLSWLPSVYLVPFYWCFSYFASVNDKKKMDKEVKIIPHFLTFHFNLQDLHVFFPVLLVLVIFLLINVNNWNNSLLINFSLHLQDTCVFNSTVVLVSFSFSSLWMV